MPFGFAGPSTSTGPGGKMDPIGIIDKYSDIIDKKYLSISGITHKRTIFFHNLSDTLDAHHFPKKYFYDEETKKVFQIFYSKAENNFLITCVERLLFAPNTISTPLEYFEFKKDESVNTPKKYVFKNGEVVDVNEKKDTSRQRVDTMLSLEDYKNRYLKEENIKNDISRKTINEEVEKVTLDENEINANKKLIEQLTEFLNTNYMDGKTIPYENYAKIIQTMEQKSKIKIMEQSDYVEMTPMAFIDFIKNQMNITQILNKKWDIYTTEITKLILSDLSKELKKQLDEFDPKGNECNKKGGKPKSKKPKAKSKKISRRRRTARKTHRRK